MKQKFLKIFISMGFNTSHIIHNYLPPIDCQPPPVYAYIFILNSK